MAYSKMFEVAVLWRVYWYASKNTDKLLLDLEIRVDIKRNIFLKWKGVEAYLQWNKEWGGGKELMNLGNFQTVSARKTERLQGWGEGTG